MTGSSFLRAMAATTSLFSVVASFASSSPVPVDDPHRVSVYDATVSALAAKPPGAFDMYILAQSWQPAFCFELLALASDAARTVARAVGSAPPSFCSGEEFDADRIERELGIDTLHQYWPDYADFWKHEWTRHGTCSGLEQVDYFTHAINLERNETLAPTPQYLQDHKLREAFGDAALKCQRSKHVTMFSQVFTCWQKDAHNVPTQRCACPPHIHSEDSCGKGSVTIPAFPADD
ncbi:Ribonuclease T2, His active site 2 [Phytophthora cactorum]|nr:Ribonuclease T2, His active site 2 [Phytophthora cactorum]